MRNTRKNAQKEKDNEGKEPLPESNLKSPGPSKGKAPPLQSWHNGQKKKFKGTLSAAKSLFQSDEEITPTTNNENQGELVEPDVGEDRSVEKVNAQAGPAPPKKKLPVSDKWNVKNFMEVDSPQIEQQGYDLEEYSGIVGGENGDRNIVYMRKGMKRSRVFVFDPEDSDEIVKF